MIQSSGHREKGKKYDVFIYIINENMKGFLRGSSCLKLHIWEKSKEIISNVSEC